MYRLEPLGIRSVRAITNLGRTWADTWDGLLEGESFCQSAKEIFPFLTVDTRVASVAGVARYFSDPVRGCSTGIELLHEVLPSNYSSPVFIGSNHGESVIISDLAERMIWEDFDDFSLERLKNVFSDPMLGANNEFRAIPVCTACSSSLSALIVAWISRKNKQELIACGCDPLSALAIAGFTRTKANHRHLCRPFDLDSDGLLIGEAAVSLTLGKVEPGECRLTGFGLSCDAHHPTSPNPRGEMVIRAIEDALQMSGLRGDELSAVVAHGTGTSLGDSAEVAALSAVIGGTVPVTSVKGRLGHTMGASGLINVAVAKQALGDGYLPAIDKVVQEARPGLDLVYGDPREIKKCSSVLCLSSGFGGSNTAVVVTRS
jgi:hypothetical protein